MNAEFPVLPFRSTLYGPEELFAGFDGSDPTSYARTPDLLAYRSTRLPASRDVGMLRALHDQCITDARDALVADRRVVAIMGGHALARDEVAYRQVAELAADLTEAGFLVASGGGPGAMEATHLGALLAPGGRASLHEAIDHLCSQAAFPEGSARLLRAGAVVDEEVLARLHAWQRPAFEVVAGVAAAQRGPSLSVPTWFYGHEPPTPFATHIAKYFSNSLREDGLLAVAADGVAFAPGRAGTLQEVFQDAAQNYYRVYGGRFSPMAFLDTGGAWTGQFPVEPTPEPVAGGDEPRPEDGVQQEDGRHVLAARRRGRDRGAPRPIRGAPAHPGPRPAGVRRSGHGAHEPTVARADPGRARCRGSLHRVGGPTTLVRMALTERDKAILEFEGSWWSRPGSKAEAIQERFELSTTRYYELLNEILADPEALEHQPLVVRRLRRERDRRRRERYQPRPATEWRSR